MTPVQKTRCTTLLLLHLIVLSSTCWATDYVDSGIVREMIDCDGSFTNGQKSLFFEELEGKRTIFRDKILSIYVERDQISLLGTFFQGIPKVKPASYDIYKRVAEKKEYTFDCRLTNYCADGLVDGDLEFSECLVSEEDYVILDDEADAASWWKRVADVPDSLAAETAASFFKNLRGGTMNGLQIGPQGASYTYEFHWRNGKIYVRKVSR